MQKIKIVLLINLFANFLRLLLRTISHAKTSSIKMRIVMMSGLFSGNRTNKMSDIYYTLINIFGYKQSFSSCTGILIYIIRKTCWVFLIPKTRYYNLFQVWWSSSLLFYLRTKKSLINIHFHFTHVNDVDLYQLRYLRNINSGLGYISVKFNTHPKWYVFNQINT